MEKGALPHIDEQLGHVAIDMGLMTPDQVTETQRRLLVVNTSSSVATTFGQEAVSLGYLDMKQLEALELEERRRRLITGYEIIDIIGTGTIATAYHALQLAMEREVALKILHPRLAGDPEFVKNYIAEAQAVSRFHHPNIVQGFDAGHSNGFYYFAHEYMSGGSITDRLRRGDADFSETKIIGYLRQTTAGLKHAWAVAVYHGDMNPGNLLLDELGNVKIANLGVPRVAAFDEGGERRPGFVRCGPDYAAPEQLERPELVNAATDIYNLGATFYHIAFGTPPFTAPNGIDLAVYRRSNPLPSFSLKSQERFSGKFLRLIHDMLEVDPAKRPSDPEALADRLEKFHHAPHDDLGGLRSQVLHVSRPSGSSGGAASSSARLAARLTSDSDRAAARHSERMSARLGSAAPSANGNERTFSLWRRKESAAPTPGATWLKAGAIVLAAAVVIGYLLFG
ncbi:MAG: serine/threonine protein kinase [Planctomycetes bacterium]|nr:serine/threonine protein kinase [Planctomycetota bacterium]